ncbi:MAG: hypothetical protein FWG73_04340 [Planctomycetaceae bacterium]|nr:hypothetical protein [Planctomycetaceae bacterium]
MDTMKTSLAPICLLAGAILLTNSIAAGQDVSHLPPNKAAIVLELRKRHPVNMGCATLDIPAAERAKFIEDELLSNLDPIQIGRNIVFSKNLFNHAVGPGRPLNRQEFEAWRERLDRVYDAFADFLGNNPGTIYFDAPPSDKFPAPTAHTAIGNRVTSITSTGGHYHPGTGVICVNVNHSRARSEWRMIRTLNSSGAAAMHEIAHVFENRQIWSVDAETFAELLISFGMENAGVQYANPRGTIIRGDAHRKNGYNDALGAFWRGGIPAFSRSSYESSAFRLYLFGLVDRVGWDTFRKVFHSYAGERSPSRNRSVQRVERARDFLDRIEYFSGRPGVLRSLPDNGRLLDQHFNVKIEDKPYLGFDSRTGLPK